MNQKNNIRLSIYKTNLNSRLKKVSIYSAEFVQKKPILKHFSSIRFTYDFGSKTDI
jgi:hypothetical protein